METPSPKLPKEARDGVMGAWLDILRERHPGVHWVPVEATDEPEHPEPRDGS